jgi:hypothetical protein
VTNKQPGDGKASQSPWSIFVAAFAGALGTAVAGLLLSSGTLNAIVNIFRPHELPQNAVIFVTSADCNSAGQDWVPFNTSVAAGHFIVAAGGDFIAGQAKPGVDQIVIDAQHLPPLTTLLPYKAGALPSGLVYNGGPIFVESLGEAGPGNPQPPVKIIFSGSGQAIPVAPPALPLTACQKK